jgi:hypothetical protein
VLYRGTRGKTKVTQDFLNSIKYFAFDPEHAYNFCEQECHLDTFTTTRELKLLYFDGTSAAKYPGTIPVDVGRSVETQDLLTWGKLMPEKDKDEAGRKTLLCEWGRQYGLDGFVRMEFDL